MFSYYSPILKNQQIDNSDQKGHLESLVQAFAQSRVSFGVRLAFLGPYPDTFRTFPRMDTVTAFTELSPCQELQVDKEML